MGRSNFPVIGAVEVLPAGATYSSDISYEFSWIEMAVDGELDGEDGHDLDQDGFSIEGKMELLPHLFGLGEAGSRALEVESDDTACSTMSFGLGGYHSFDLVEPPELDAYGTLS